MPLDEMTRRNLELVESMRGADRAGTLLDVLDRTMTPMGARLLRAWVLAPLTDRTEIEARLDAVRCSCAIRSRAVRCARALDGVRDIERLAGKAAAGRAKPRELGALGAFTRPPRRGRSARRGKPDAAGVLAAGARGVGRCADIAAAHRQPLVERPPAMIGEEEVVAPGGRRRTR